MIKSLATKAMLAAGAATVAISTVSAPAEAAVITYTDRANWQSALSGLGWSASPPEQFNAVIPDADSIIFANGVLSDGSPNTQFGVNQVVGGAYNGGLTTSATSPFYTQIKWTFPTSTRGFGADWFNTFSGGAASLQVTIAGQTINIANALGGGGNGFLGFISDTPFTEATFSVGGSGDLAYDADNLSYAQNSTVVPTPALLPGLIGMGIAAWRKRKGEAAETEA
ncbi:MAG: PTPA-CTERM sorting domain-containing protein [Leptolyngbyaceae cyanobacterium]